MALARPEAVTGADAGDTRPHRPRATPLTALTAALASWSPGEPVRTDSTSTEPLITGLSLSTERVRPGDLYAALPGTRAHGASYAAQAVSAGAVAVLTDPAGAVLVDHQALDVPVVTVSSPRAVLGRLAARVYGDPGVALGLIGITGTQGKTTTTRLLEGGLQAAGTPTGAIGTLGTRITGREVKTALTTPEAPDLQGLLARMRECGVVACAMEVSSHALVLGRVDGLVFDVAVFLNLGRDHLDFHADLEDYFAAKASLFTPARARLGLVNADDAHGRRLLDRPAIPLRSFALHAEADWRAVDLRADADGSSFTVRGPGVEVTARCPLPGEFNVANTLAAIAAAAEAGYDAQAVATGIAAGGGVPGRLERVETGRPYAVVVDYAHKPDAVAAILGALRPLTDGALILVLGAGGDRDPGKRPLMGEIAARLADVLVVTDDNPRTEDPAMIRAQVLAGARGAGHQGAEVVEIGDRRLAIRAALERARPGDIVLVAGKGHETGQEVAGVVHPFDDRQVVREETAP